MAKQKKAYNCTECGAHSMKWAGQCPECSSWNTLAETTAGPASAPAGGPAARAINELSIDIDKRYETGFGEFDRVLGGGLVPGSVVLLGGDPGVGKSTLLQQISARLEVPESVLYASGEESLRQVAQRGQRLGIVGSEIQFVADTSLDHVLAEAKRVAARVLIIEFFFFRIVAST